MRMSGDRHSARLTRRHRGTPFGMCTCELAKSGWPSCWVEWVRRFPKRAVIDAAWLVEARLAALRAIWRIEAFVSQGSQLLPRKRTVTIHGVTIHGVAIHGADAASPPYFAGDAAAGVVVLAPWDEPLEDPPSDDELEEPVELVSPDDGAAPEPAAADESEVPPDAAPADDPLDEPVRASFL